MIEQIFNFKKGIGIKSEKYGNKLKMELSDHRTKG